MRGATVTSWAEYFEKHEGVKINALAIKGRLKKAGIIGRHGRNKVGRLLKSAFFSESNVRKACVGLLVPGMPQADKSGFFVVRDSDESSLRARASAIGRELRPKPEPRADSGREKEGVKYGTTSAWGRSLPIS